jgi:hypothetical protein
LGGYKDVKNIVSLTYKEHYISHLLLYKITWKNKFYQIKSLYSFKFFYHDSAKNSKMYEKYYENLKMTISDSAKKRFANKENHPMYGRIANSHTRELMSLIHKGKFISKEQIEKSKISSKNFRWITNGIVEYKCVLTDDLISKGYYIGRINNTHFKYNNPAKDPSIREQWSKNRKGKFKGGKNPAAIKCCINGKEFSCKKDAAEELNITIYELNKMIKLQRSSND